ncbi:protein translocase subunit SecD [Luteolibacter marinus]|uniref:protein translocase subunit SecD n=1 Tax=Luteolibacter marinus TaxID=2776705 RepID=UPI001865DEEC|nr:protein translocase subunit SecD [Luteolibacter marinus]
MFPSTFFASILLKDPMFLFLSGLGLLVLFFWYFATELESRKRNVGTFLILGICGLMALALYPPKESLKGGIDLVGGSSFTLQVKPKLDETTGQPIPLMKEDVTQAKSIIEKRLNERGTKDLQTYETGEDKILVQMPGMSPEESEEVKELLEKVARLELRRVNLEGFHPGPDGRTLAERIDSGDEPRKPGFGVFKHSYEDREGNTRTEFLLLNNRVALTGKDVATAYPETMGASHNVAITLTSAGGDKMINLTKDMAPGRDRIAVVLDGEVITAPTVQSVPLGKRFQIEGQSSHDEARSLSNALKNPLENPLEIIETRVISPTLGAAVITQGIWAGIIGLTLTALFVLIYYRTAGLVALIGLTVNTIMIFGGMAMFGFTFTLPGIAGMILSIGMAVDANVLIYERLREEIGHGKSLKSAISAAYDKAFSAIFDSNITSLITALILFWMGSGTVKGFAITLTIGLLSSIFSAILVTRVMFRWGNDLHLLKKLSFLDLIKSSTFDFLSKVKPAYVVSGLLLLASLGGFVFRGQKGLGIDFTGGTQIQFELGSHHIEQAAVEASLEKVQTSKRPSVQEEKAISGEQLTIRCADQDVDAIVANLRESFPILGEKVEEVKNGEKTGDMVYAIQQSTDSVSAALGKDFMIESCIALGLGLLGILTYITLRFEFSFALGGFLALIHDVVMSAGIIILCGGELSLIHVAALLTIAGYSVNDTIIIFDRIRESLKEGDGDVKILMNEAINATLSRTILTSLTTIATVTVLAILGTGQLQDFSLMILIGLIVGTYSSIFIAAPVVLWWSERKGGSLRKEILHTTLAESDIQTVN